MFKKIYVVAKYHTVDERARHWLYSNVEQIGGNYNLISDVERLKRENASIIMVCGSKKEAQELAADWNNSAKEAGLYGWADWANEEYRKQERKAI